MAFGGPFDLSEELDDICECAVCLGDLEDPKLLPCGHSFCLTCIDKSHTQDTAHGYYASNQFRCPTCLGLHPLPAGKTSGLPGDHRTQKMMAVTKKQKEIQGQIAKDICFCNSCTEEGRTRKAHILCIPCKETHCQECEKMHDEIPGHDNHTRINIDHNNTSSIICKTHTKKFFTRYCVTCSVPVCMVCVLATHTKHQLVDFIPKNKVGKTSAQQQLRSYLNKLLSMYTKHQLNINETRSTSQISSNAIKREIKQSFETAIKQLEQQKEKLLTKADTIQMKYKTSLAGQKAKCDKALQDLNQLTSQLEEVSSPLGLKTDLTVDVELPLESIKETCKQLQATVNLPAIHQNDLIFQPPKIASYGTLEIKEQVQPHSIQLPVVCLLCFGPPTNLVQPWDCPHKFCAKCLDTTSQMNRGSCPCCGKNMAGLQPPGEMVVNKNYKNHGVSLIQMKYTFAAGIHKVGHPHPGQPYKGLQYTGYLPQCPGSDTVLRLLQKAFDKKVLFVINKNKRVQINGVRLCQDPDSISWIWQRRYLDGIKEDLAKLGITE